jgi:hypothetical protein
MKMPTPPKTSSEIRVRLALLVLAAALPVWLLSGVLVFQAYGAKREQVNKNMLDTSRSLAMRLDRELTGVQAAMQALATSPTFYSGDFAGVHSQALLLLKSYPGADIIVADATGQQLLNSARPLGSRLPKRNNPETVRRNRDRPLHVEEHHREEHGGEAHGAQYCRWCGIQDRGLKGCALRAALHQATRLAPR